MISLGDKNTGVCYTVIFSIFLCLKFFIIKRNNPQALKRWALLMVLFLKFWLKRVNEILVMQKVVFCGWLVFLRLGSRAGGGWGKALMTGAWSGSSLESWWRPWRTRTWRSSAGRPPSRSRPPRPGGWASLRWREKPPVSWSCVSQCVTDGAGVTWPFHRKLSH